MGFVTRAEASGPPLAELAVSWGDDGLVRTLDGKATPLASYLAVLPVAIWTNREDEILAGVPERRRRMIDAGLIAERPERVALLARHRRVLAQKRELLRRRQSGLEAWNRLLAEAGSALQRARADWVANLAARLDRVLVASQRGLPPVELRYEPSPSPRPRRPRRPLRSAGGGGRRRDATGPPLHRTPPRSTLHRMGGDAVREAPDRPTSRGSPRPASARRWDCCSPRRRRTCWKPPAGPRPSWSTTSTPSSTWALSRRSGGSSSQGRQVLATSSRAEVADRLGEVVRWGLEGGSGGVGPVRE